MNKQLMKMLESIPTKFLENPDDMKNFFPDCQKEGYDQVIMIRDKSNHQITTLFGVSSKYSWDIMMNMAMRSGFAYRCWTTETAMELFNNGMLE